MVLCKSSVPGRPTNLNNSMANGLLCLQQVRVGMFGHFFLLFLSSFFFLPLWETVGWLVVLGLTAL